MNLGPRDGVVLPCTGLGFCLSGVQGPASLYGAIIPSNGPYSSLLTILMVRKHLNNCP